MKTLDDGLLAFEEAAEYLNVSASTLRRSGGPKPRPTLLRGSNMSLRRVRLTVMS